MNNQHRIIKTDEELLQLYHTTKDKSWLGLLLQRYTLLLFGVGMKYLKNEENAKDAVQQVFMKVISDFDKYDVTYFKSWLYTAMKNHCLMQLRKKGIYTSEIDTRIHESANEESAREEQFQKEEQFHRLAAGLQQLNDAQKICITLFYLEKKSYNEVSHKTGFSLQEVKSHIQNGKRNLKNIMLNLNKNDRG